MTKINAKEGIELPAQPEGVIADRALFVDGSDNFLKFKDQSSDALRIIHLDNTGKLPAVDGSNLTGITAGLEEDSLIFTNDIRTALSLDPIANLVTVTGNHFTNCDTGNTNCTRCQVYFALCNPFDNFVGGSMVTNGWTGTWSGTDGRLEYSSNGTHDSSIITNGTSGLNMKGQDTEVIVYVDQYLSGTTGGPANYFEITDGSSNVTISAQTGTGTTAGLYRIVVNNSAQTVNAWRDGSQILTNQSISHLSNWYIKFRSKSTSGGSTTRIRVYSIGYAMTGDTPGTAEYVTNDNTGLVSSEKVIMDGDYLNYDNQEVDYSLNAGSSYEDGIPQIITTMPSSFTSLKFKFTGALLTTIDNTKRNIVGLTKYGYLHY